MPRPVKVEPVAMFETIQQIGIYLHRFHNLDLFRQGWYQIKITIRWEDSEDDIPHGIPARVVQYEAPDLGPSSIYGLWRIDDTDNSFSTQPFRIKYARQDIHLCMMITFNLARSRFEDLATAAAILKFELMYAPTVENGADLQTSLDDYPAAIHEFRIPPKALLGLHSYCPVHFDALHAVLVDASVHVSLLKAASYPSASKRTRNSANTDVIVDKSHDTLNHDLGGVASVDVKNVMLVKALLTARGILLDELQRISKAVDQAIDISDFLLKMNNTKLLNSLLQANQFATDVEVSGQGQPQSGLEDENGTLDFLNAEKLYSLSQNELLDCFHLLGDQLFYLWNIFLKFHRDNKTKILEFLHDAWAKDRKAEWSIWMVYSTVEMPHHYINNGSDESSNQGGHKRVPSLVKLPDEPPQSAASRAELHRRSIAQMQINNRSIQDMYIFGEPLRVPIVIVERVMNTPRRNSNQNSYLRHMQTEPSLDTMGKKSAPKSIARLLKIVVFVHGFQGHHLDLRLVRNQWLLMDPKVEVLMSEANEDKTSGDFREMGQRLAQEVVSFVKNKMDKASKYENLGDIKISFVGHSIGNLIIRTAIADDIMEPFLRYLHTYVSVSGPHLGYLYSSNSLFNSGLWFFKKLKNTQCIHQLTFTDDPDFQNTFLYKLCKQKTLEHFRNIILLSSPQDGYVPYHSARIESCPAASHDSSKKGSCFLEMLNDCLDQIRANPSEHRVFMRCDVNFDATAYGKNLNSFIGRAAHIEFLESDIFMKFIMWSFPELFQ
ncbi:PREDICTED: protein FAM135B-like isoform X1 [Lupinus angustifolius]|uniref:protein FAM135B-like isoform X1 n=2 Tax=Lupinus angustifolius TaxID=3871 RepID=UPI00092F12DC|nr:PREDICTED: protein FAM135B-like isoform X1 [Lupinus angustifolius]XP_019415414.1 PREDICTED: protein FAM135B-like isoform X1 [Lupinus angustifolius]XP_019415415.1 PREDICTED: protein FAM135B-like isoform X1 [Lupinus angustifolius]XP_019415416.1 PREDICTED: protein FAM135B-like isoform X1 [Lupinus angustifolius]XP_019415417.1 PREDICTED: protein FAM135B-like isoform X1 [Lupinus angustifolius]